MCKLSQKENFNLYIFENFPWAYLFLSQIWLRGIWLHLHCRALIWKKKEKSNKKKIPLSLGMLHKKRRNLVNKSLLDSHCSDLSIIFYTTLWHIYFRISFVWLLGLFFSLCRAFFGCDSLVLGEARSSKREQNLSFQGPALWSWPRPNEVP